MLKISIYGKYSINKIASELNFSKKLENNIKKYFGNRFSIFDLTQIKRKDFLSCKGLGWKSWIEFDNAVSTIQIPNDAVKLLEKSGPTKIIVEIDLSTSFAKVIRKLSEFAKDIK